MNEASVILGIAKLVALGERHFTPHELHVFVETTAIHKVAERTIHKHHFTIVGHSTAKLALETRVALWTAVKRHDAIVPMNLVTDKSSDIHGVAQLVVFDERHFTVLEVPSFPKTTAKR